MDKKFIKEYILLYVEWLNENYYYENELGLYQSFKASEYNYYTSSETIDIFITQTKLKIKE